MFAQEAPITWAAAWAIMLGVGLLLVLSGLLVAGIAERTADGRMGMNGLAGIRTQATMSSEAAWRAAHREGRRFTAFGGRMLSAGAFIAIGAGLWFGEGDPDRSLTAWAIAVGIASVVILIPILLGARAGHRAAVAVRDRRGD